MVECFTFGINNCYILHGEKYAILIDTCPQQYSNALLNVIKNKNISLLLLTHGHTDHIGCADYIAKRLSIPIAMAQEDHILIERPNARPLFASTPLGFLICQGIKKQKTVPFFQPDIFLTHGQRLEEFGIQGRIFALPGHTAGSVGVWTARKEFFVGDAMMHIGFSLKPRLYENKSNMEQSFRNIWQSDATAIYMGHGTPVFRQARPIFKPNIVTIKNTTYLDCCKDMQSITKKIKHTKEEAHCESTK